MAYNQQKFTFLCSGALEVQGQGASRSGVCPVFIDDYLFAITTHGRRARELSQTSFMKALILFMGLHLHDLSVSLRRYLLISLWALRFQRTTIGGHKHTLCNPDTGDLRHYSLGDSFYCCYAMELEASFPPHSPASFSAALSPPE